MTSRTTRIPLVAAAFWLACTPLAGAATFVVDRTDDTAAATACTAAPNDCSLRGAVLAANASGADDRIDVPAGTYVLTVAGTDDTAAAGDLDVLAAGALEIVGAGAAATVLDGNALSRVLDVQSGAAATVRSLTVRNGRETSDEGGGIRSASAALLLDAVAVRDSTATDAGGVYSYFGGLILTDTTVAGNTATAGGGGGIAVIGGVSTITRATISGNRAGGGGGLFLQGGTHAIERSTVDDNETLTSGGNGGGILVVGSGSYQLTNTTVSGNRAGLGGGIVVLGGAGGLVSLNNVTLTGNDAAIGGGLARYDFMGAGSPTVEVANTIGGGNTASSSGPDCSTMAGFTDQPILVRGYVLVESFSGCSVDPGSDLTGGIVAPPDLGPLAFNGGPTRTHRPNPTSPVLNAGNPAAPGSGPYTCATGDQRGATRPSDGACDMGAVEVQDPPVCGDGTVDGAEVCDGGPCCAPDCLGTASLGTPCDDDGNACTTDWCDGAGACVHPPAPAGQSCGYAPCVRHLCDGAGACDATETPRPDCFLPLVSGRSALQLKDKTPAAPGVSDTFGFKWLTGEEAGPSMFGDPTSIDDDTVMCVFDANGLVMEAHVPSGGTCVGVPCWSRKEDGQGFESYKYVDKTKSGLPDGIQKILYQDKSGPGKSKLLVKGKGMHLDFDPLPWTPPVTAQLVSSRAECWQATFSLPIKNELEQFKAKAD